MSELITRDFLETLRAQFRLDWHGAHGVAHWGRVRFHGLRLARAVGADLRVVELFAFLHDSQRANEHDDPDHGPRAAHYATGLQGQGTIRLDDAALERLVIALDGHTRGSTHPDPTVQVCWDADRLDLGRVGIYPDARRLGTEAARDPELIERAWRWGQQHASRIAGAGRARRSWYMDDDGLTRLSDLF